MTIEITGVRREGQVDLKVTQRGLEMTFTESYHVMSDSKLNTYLDVMRYAIAVEPEVQALMGYVDGVLSDTLPFPNQTVHRDGVSVCQSLGGQQEELNPLKWIFTAQWSTNVAEGSTGQAGNPTIDPVTTVPIRETLHEVVTRHRSKDLSGRAYTNGAGNLYNPALSVEEELPRWDFTQIERAYTGPIGNTSATFDGLSTSGGSVFSILTEWSKDASEKVVPPGVYRYDSGSWSFWAPTDATVFYFNGCVNAVPFLGFPAFTLLLKVRSSKLLSYFGVKHRVTDYSIVYDEQNHWDKPINAGPFFRAPELDDVGFPLGNEISYPYIYYSADEEDTATDLSQEDAGPLGYYNSTLVLDNDPGSPYQVKRLLQPTDKPTGDGSDTSTILGIGGAVAGVKTATGKWVYRAVKPGPGQDLYHIEYQNHNILYFADHLRIV
jgi:hypothetical protein